MSDSSDAETTLPVSPVTDSPPLRPVKIGHEVRDVVQYENLSDISDLKNENLSDISDLKDENLSDISSVKERDSILRQCWDRYNSLLADSWCPEILCWGFSLICFNAVIFILWYYDRGPLPRFPYNITVSTLVALFTSLSVTALMEPVSQGISQLKWVRLSGQGKRAVDFERYDQASRGVWGSIFLITSSARGYVSSIGAAITILVLAANSITQQSITYVPWRVIDPHGRAVTPFCTVFNTSSTPQGPQQIRKSYGSLQPDMRTRAAVHNGLFSGNSSATFLPLGCSTGNCTWPEYRTLAVCSSLSDVSDLIVTQRQMSYSSDLSFNNVSSLTGVGEINWGKAKRSKMVAIVRPTGPYLPPNRKSRVSKSIDETNRTKQSQNFEKNTTVAEFYVFWLKKAAFSMPKIQAIEINLHFCVQELNSNVRNGKSSTVENTHERITEFKYQFEYPKDPKAEIIPWYYMTASPLNSNESFKVLGQAQQTLFQYSRVVFNGTWEDPGARALDSSSNGMAIEPISQIVYHWTDPKEGLRALANNVAVSLSNRLRAESSAVHSGLHHRPIPPKLVTGKAYHVDTYVKVSWAWITLLAVLVAASLAFLLAVMQMNRSCNHKLWRTSNLALMQALDVSRPRLMTGICSNLEMERHAEKVDLQLRKDGGVWHLVKTARVAGLQSPSDTSIQKDKSGLE